MLIKNPKGWELPESAATSESAYMNRRQLMKGAAAGTILAAAGPVLSSAAHAATEEDPSAHLYPVKQNMRYQLDREITPEKVNGTYNNFYEFGSHKEIWRASQRLPLRPWTLRVDGMVENEMEFDIDDLLAKMPLEERLYRHRCVEAWSMSIPWSGFELSHLIKMVQPLGSAKYIELRSFVDKSFASGQRQFWYPWPYVEGLTIEEGMNELTFMATGTYGHPAPPQHGAPLRIALPWKYGFKSVKSIVSITFTDKRPISFWEEVQAAEYGFWANVNPEFDHPRWTQATERVLGSSERVPTLLYNGYAEFVTGLYKDMPQDRTLFM
ncbi:MAG: protein-methionine-sulfoxide reductase catalytic subunit MsrP [Alphaproteobacteria bacterium]|nr:protein-methionine-sulfoxide reductase catalytic subunit MsrP [Alphaproteobacteria bacterium]